MTVGSPLCDQSIGLHSCPCQSSSYGSICLVRIFTKFFLESKMLPWTQGGLDKGTGVESVHCDYIADISLRTFDLKPSFQSKTCYKLNFSNAADNYNIKL